METKNLIEFNELTDKVRPILEEIKTYRLKDIKTEYGSMTQLITSLQVGQFSVKINYTNVSVYIDIYCKGLQVESLRLSDCNLSVRASNLFSDEIENLKTNMRKEWQELLHKSY